MFCVYLMIDLKNYHKNEFTFDDFALKYTDREIFYW